MDVLPDTHALIWFINGDNPLPDKSVKLISKLETRCFVSIVSIWEIAIKLSLGKPDLGGGFDEVIKIMKRFVIDLLPITFEHLQQLLTLEFHHRDPFDRIIIAQGLTEKFAIITKDEHFAKFNAKIIWDK